MLTAFMGAGALALPATFHKTGIVGGIVGFAFVGIINIYTMIILVYAKRKLARPISSYKDLSMLVLSDKEN